MTGGMENTTIVIDIKKWIRMRSGKKRARKFIKAINKIPELDGWLDKNYPTALNYKDTLDAFGFIPIEWDEEMAALQEVLDEIISLAENNITFVFIKH